MAGCPEPSRSSPPPRTSQSFAFLTPALSYDANDVFLGFTQTTAFPSVALTRNQASTATALQALGLGNPLFNVVVGQSVAGARQAFDALSGEVHASAVTTAFEDARLPREAILDRLNEPLDTPVLGAATTMTGAYAADLPRKGPALAPVEVRMYQPRLFGLWGQGFGDWGRTGSDRNAASLSRSTGGFVVGADVAQTLWGGTWRLGLAGGYTSDSITVRQRLSSGTFESVFGGALWRGELRGHPAAGRNALWGELDLDHAQHHLPELRGCRELELWRLDRAGLRRGRIPHPARRARPRPCAARTLPRGGRHPYPPERLHRGRRHCGAHGLRAQL